MTRQCSADLNLYDRRMAAKAQAPEAAQAHERVVAMYLGRFCNRYTTPPTPGDR